MLAPHRHTKTPTRGSRPATGFSGGQPRSEISAPRASRRSSEQRAAALEALVTDSGMSRGPSAAPATKTPGRAVEPGSRERATAKPHGCSSIPTVRASSRTDSGGARPVESTRRSKRSVCSLPSASTQRISRSRVSGTWSTRETMERS